MFLNQKTEMPIALAYFATVLTRKKVSYFNGAVVICR
jgi:hypothetical protein